MGPITGFLNRFLYYPVIIILVFNLIQRRFMDRGKLKRFATLTMGVLVLALWGITFFFKRFAIPDVYLILPVLASGALLYAGRRRIFAFRLFCRKCGKRLSVRTVLFEDSNLCGDCLADEPVQDAESHAAWDSENHHKWDGNTL